MRLQIVRLTKLLATNLTTVRLLASVNLHVCREIIRLDESFAAHGAF